MLTKRKWWLLCLMLGFGPLVWGQIKTDSTYSEGSIYSLPVENNISYNQSLKQKSLDYDLEPIAEGTFKLIFVNRPSDYVSIKIYDIIGNLILQEDHKYALSSEIEYNLNENNGKIYVVKVEAGDDNLIKKVNF